jgi:hypothetical protein
MKILYNLVSFLLLINIIMCSKRQLNIFSLMNGEEKLAESYKSLLINLINHMLNSLEIKPPKSVQNLCLNETENLFKSHREIFYKMFLHSGLSSRVGLGEYQDCISLSINSKSISKYIIIEEYFLEKEKIKYGVCVPSVCGTLLYMVENEVIKLNNGTFTLSTFPLLEKGDKKGNVLIYVSHSLWIMLFIAYIIVVIFLNLFIECFKGGFNPYYLKKLKIEENTEIKESYILNYTEKQLNSSFLLQGGLNSNETVANKKGLSCFHTFYYNYLSLTNNFYILSQVRSTIYNDTKLRLIAGLMTFFSFYHVMSCALDNLLILSTDDKLSSETGSNPLIFFYPLYNNLGKLWLESITFFWAFFITYKFLNFFKMENVGLCQLIKWISRHIDKLTLFIIFNIWFIISIDFIMKFFFKDKILWFLYDKNVNQCHIVDFLPFYEFYLLVMGFDLTPKCMKSKCYFLQGLYVLCFTLILLKYTKKSKNKFLIFTSILTSSFILRTVFTMIYSYTNRDKYSLYYSIEMLHLQFFYNIPNLSLGIICAHTYYYEVHIEEINRGNFFEYFKGFDKLRNAFYSYSIFKNFCFLFSIITLFFYCGFINKIIQIQFIRDDDLISLFLLSINGFIISLMIFLLILSMKLQGSELWKLNSVINKFCKNVLNSNILLILSRCLLIVNVGHTGIINLVVTIFVNTSIHFDIFTVYEFYGLALCVLIYCFGFVVTLFIEVPIRSFVRKIIKIEK